MRRRFIVEIEGAEVNVASLRPIHIEYAITDALKIPHEEITITEEPK